MAVNIGGKMAEFSARKYMVEVFCGTYCVVILILAIAMLKKLIEPTVFLGALVGFAGLCAQISDWYFKREDRNATQPKGEVK